MTEDQGQGPQDETVDDDELEDYVPTADEIRPVSATWSVSVFENSLIGLQPGVHMGIEVECEDMPEEEMASDESMSVSVDWIPFDGKDFRAIKGETFSGEIFGEQVEPSMYFDGIHYRFDKVTVEVLDQRGWTTDFRIRISGDVDNLGLEEFELAVTAEFTGVGYGLETPGRMAEFVGTTGLVPSDSGPSFVPPQSKRNSAAVAPSADSESEYDVASLDAVMNGPLSPDLRQAVENSEAPDAEALLRSAVRPLAQRPALQLQNTEAGRTILDVLFWLVSDSRPVHSVDDFSGNADDSATPNFRTMASGSFVTEEKRLGIVTSRHPFTAWWNSRLEAGALEETGSGFRLTEAHLEPLLEELRTTTEPRP